MSNINQPIVWALIIIVIEVPLHFSCFFFTAVTLWLLYILQSWIKFWNGESKETLSCNFGNILFSVFTRLLSGFPCSFTQTQIKATDPSGTFWTGKELELYLSSMKWQEIFMPLRAWIGKGKHIMFCMHKLWTATQRRPWNQSRNSSSKYKTSMTMHPNFQMDPL